MSTVPGLTIHGDIASLLRYASKHSEKSLQSLIDRLAVLTADWPDHQIDMVITPYSDSVEGSVLWYRDGVVKMAGGLIKHSDGCWWIHT